MDKKNFSTLKKAMDYVKGLSERHPGPSFTLTKKIIKYL